jgi:hypothetical protein
MPISILTGNHLGNAGMIDAIAQSKHYSIGYLQMQEREHITMP